MTSWGGSRRISARIPARPAASRGAPCSTCAASRRCGPIPGKVQPLAAQIGWTHHQVLIDAFGENPDLYVWYATKAAENRWSRRYLKGQIDPRLHERQGAALTNFPRALEPADADRALQAIKDPYVPSTKLNCARRQQSPTRTPVGPSRRDERAGRCE
jgi:hypothetical protein